MAVDKWFRTNGSVAHLFRSHKAKSKPMRFYDDDEDTDKPSDKIREATREEERLTEDEIARRKLGPRGVPGAPDTATMTPQYEKNLPKEGEFDGHVA